MYISKRSLFEKCPGHSFQCIFIIKIWETNKSYLNAHALGETVSIQNPQNEKQKPCPLKKLRQRHWTPIVKNEYIARIWVCRVHEYNCHSRKLCGYDTSPNYLPNWADNQINQFYEYQTTIGDRFHLRNWASKSCHYASIKALAITTLHHSFFKFDTFDR